MEAERLPLTQATVNGEVVKVSRDVKDAVQDHAFTAGWKRIWHRQDRKYKIPLITRNASMEVGNTEHVLQLEVLIFIPGIPVLATQGGPWEIS